MSGAVLEVHLLENCMALRREGYAECGRQNTQIKSSPEHYRKLSGGKSLRLFGAKRLSKATVAKHITIGIFLEVEMLNLCMPLWREAYFKVKFKNTALLEHLRTYTT